MNTITPTEFSPETRLTVPLTGAKLFERVGLLVHGDHAGVYVNLSSVFVGSLAEATEKAETIIADLRQHGLVETRQYSLRCEAFLNSLLRGDPLTDSWADEVDQPNPLLFSITEDRPGQYRVSWPDRGGALLGCLIEKATAQQAVDAMISHADGRPVYMIVATHNADRSVSYSDWMRV